MTVASARQFTDALAVRERVLCACGCGRLAPLAVTTRPERGYSKGDPLRFCPGHNRRRLAAAERFRRLLRETKNGCIEFQGHRLHGYGQFGIGSRDDGDRRLVYAHRYAWELAGRVVPPGLKVLHTCDNPACCNVEHLFVGDDATNLEDMAKKWRGRKGRLPFGAARNHKRFFSRVRFRNRNYYLGTYDTPEEASAIAVMFKETLHGI